VKVWTTRSQNNTRHGQHATGTQHRCWHSDVARTVSKGEHADNVHVQQTREKALLIDWWRTLGWQKSNTPTTRNSSTKSLVWSSRSGVTLMYMTPPKHTQAKVECAGLLHAVVCSSAPQCLEPLPAVRIVRVASQNHRVHLLAATRYGCARSEQKHESAQVRRVCPLCAVVSRSAARAIPLFNLGHQRNFRVKGLGFARLGQAGLVSSGLTLTCYNSRQYGNS